ncbi:MAG: NAD(P)H-hydrate dehydratase [Thermogutta sp.]|nr:NAD(P)H-hydrate dehydratase [Thermogutta sp.]HOP78736.1 NAD(P)H-hydrate dehydratase [Thermogutta sp.]HPU07723.1 NAD(P)H-hydrate dehydratase [Thermogutta sp.]HQF15100.1 NAD(P)H-hydrate dehydratase [Thermogutta sp.]
MIQVPFEDNPHLPVLPIRPRDAHKGHFGTVLIVGGSLGMTGAAGLAGMAALRGGAGLVRVAVPEPVLPIVAGYEPSYTTIPLPADSAGRISYQALKKIRVEAELADWVALGPGLGRSWGLSRLVSQLYRDLPNPLVVDADGLNALVTLAPDIPPANGPRILTPHPGEFRRLVGPGADPRAPLADRWQLAQHYAAVWDAVVVYKGHPTLVTDGKRRYFNPTGNPGMATGGSGDVLTGLIAALGAQGLDSFSAAQLGVYLHGLAGDLGAKDLGEESLIASDLLRYLPLAFQKYRETSSKTNG